MDNCQRPLESPITAPNDVTFRLLLFIITRREIKTGKAVTPWVTREGASPRGSQEKEHNPTGHRRGSKGRRKLEGAGVLPVRRLKPQAAATCKSGWLEAPTPARLPSEEEETQLAVFAAPEHMYTVRQGQKLKIAMFSQRAVRHPNRILNL